MGAANVYLNGNARQLWDIYYQDRAERAAKFGYAMPKDYEMTPQPAFPAVRAGVFAEQGVEEDYLRSLNASGSRDRAVAFTGPGLGWRRR